MLELSVLCIVNTNKSDKRNEVYPMKRLICLWLLLGCLAGYGQDKWTIDRCVQYAVTHNHDVRLQSIALHDCKIEKESKVGAFLPSVGGNIGGQFNFGRAIDPETNTYTNVSTFYNSYGVSVGIPLFDGLQRYNDLRAAKADVLMGRSRLEAQKDETARQVLESCVQLLYYQGCIDIAVRKRSESEQLLRQTKVMVEVGQKGEADVAQMQATFASDDYEVARQQSLYDNALLALKQLMNYPIDEPLEIAPYDEVNPDVDVASPEELYRLGRLENPDIKQAEFNLKSATYAYRSSKGALFPAISLGAGVSTTYYKQLDVPGKTSFSDQFRNNAGEYVYATLSIPLFNRLQTLGNIRRRRNNVKRAKEELAYRDSELRRLIQETVTDLQNSRKETEKMRLKVASDSIATRLTVRKYEEGLASSVDVQTQSVILLQSREQLLQCRLNCMYKTRMMNYYQGKPLWTE